MRAFFANCISKRFSSRILFPLVGFLLLGSETPDAWADVTATANGVAPASSSQYSVTETGPNHRVWQQVVAQTNELGRITYKTNAYTELATGLNHLAAGQWVASSEEIEITQDGAAATNGPHQVYFAANLNTAGAIHLVTPGGAHMRSHIMGLSYFDSSTGQSVLIAELQDSTGQVLPSLNQALYTNAFTDFQADVRYTYTKAGFEQDIILRQQPPSPSEWKLNPQTTRLQVWTEFTEAPVPNTNSTIISESGLLDHDLNFGSMHMGRGKAFNIGTENVLTPIAKRWQVVDGRKFLVEEVPFNSVAPQLQSLPTAPPTLPNNSAPAPQSAPPPSDDQSNLHKRPRMSEHPVLRLPKLVRNSMGPMQMASAVPERKGFVLDYNTVNGSLTNFVFQSDSTYFVTNAAYLYGQTIFEGGAVIKYSTNASASIFLQYSTNLVCSTTPYRPVVFTGRDDDYVGSTITGSTHTPSNFYGGVAIQVLNNNAGIASYRNLRFSYLRTALQWDTNTCYLYDAQFLNCQIGINCNGNTYLRNALFYGVTTNFYCTPAPGNLDLQNVTVHNSTLLCNVVGGGTFNVCLTNCLLINVSALGTSVITNTTATVASEAGIFQTVGGGKNYLSDDSPYRNSGTTNLDPILLSALAHKTTYPPIVLSNFTFSANTTLRPEVNRDTNSQPDLGYHYDPIDFAIHSSTVAANVTLSLTNGAVIAEFGSLGFGNVPFYFAPGAQLISIGQPQNLNWLVRYQTVQEQLWFNGPLASYISVFDTNANAVCQFTGFALALGRGQGLILAESQNYFTVANCQIFNTSLVINTPHDYYSMQATNNLFFRCATTFRDYNPWDPDFGPSDITLQNNTFIGGNLVLSQDNVDVIDWLVYNNLFAQVSISSTGTGQLDNGNNAYYLSTNLPSSFGNDITLSNLDFQSGPLGTFYYPTTGTNLSRLIDAGTISADQLGMFHFTTQTNQLKETNSMVDIGYHYVAVNGSGLPVSTSGDGIGDYLKDSNGNGSYENATDFGNWLSNDSCGNGINDSVKYLQGRNLNICPATTDTNGILHLEIFTPLMK